MIDENMSTVNLLLIEDSPADTYLIRHTLQSYFRNITIYEANTGEDGLQQLADVYNEGEIIHILLLDLNLPGIDGFDVANHIKTHPRYSSIPIVVLTSSTNQYDIDRIYKLHANCYITKPVTLDKFVETLKLLGEFWIDLVHLPK